MFLDWVNGIPIVGLAKGLVHYAVGDVEGGHKAVKQSTRTSVVMGAGAVGCIGGPGGAVALGTATGCLWDSVETVVTDEHTGIVAGIKKIGDTVSKGEVPYEGVLETAFCIGGDAVGAYGGASLLSSFSKSVGKEAIKKAIKQEVDNAVPNTIKYCLSQKGRSLGPTSSGSGQEPPGQNPSNNNGPSQQEQTESYIQKFLDLFNVESLDDISIRGQHIFKRLKFGQERSLKKIIKILVEKGILENVIETLKNIFNIFELQDVTFVNFLSLVEVIMQYIGERAARNNEMIRERQEFPDSYDLRRTESIRIACDEMLPHDYTIVRVFNAIKDMIMIERQASSIDFRDIFAAVYHYFKHRRVGQVELSVHDYYDCLQRNADIIKDTKEYKELKDGGKKVFEIYDEVYKAWFRIVIKKKDDRMILCTGFFLDDYHGTDRGF